MKTKISLLFFLFLFVVHAQAQYVNFKLQKDGSFIAEDGKNYVVIDYEGKTASELYSMVKSNVMNVYNNPEHVMSENKPTKITIDALTGQISFRYNPFGGGFVSYSAYYKYIFQFKDGRIRVDAPIVKQDLKVSSAGAAYGKTFVELIDGWFDKEGKVKQRKKEDVEEMENIFVLPINYLLGNINTNSSDDDW
ncbi:MAG: hypothetical protein IJZ22_08320 [Bacteroidaceae bacterium]|nr:hypothetical protein [Bacteroidaceae bacterium]